ncbi:regulatory protein RecX [Elioraea sp.]|uniref:regulatory protein RecX n=1 Tax=Elioraea sp. TaxID=2185103 RepID=UPI003F6EA352
MSRRPRTPHQYPTEAVLREAALAHLARFSATRAGLLRVLTNRIARWARDADLAAEDRATAITTARAAAEAVVDRLVAVGAVDDAAFAQARARRLARAGRSAPAIAAHLAGKGAGDVAGEAIDAAFPDRDAQLATALIAARKRRIGPYGPPDPPPEARLKALAALARAGFSRAIAEAALAMDPDEAEARIAAFRR